MSTSDTQHKKELAALTGRELAACWNICQFQRRFGSVHENEHLIFAEMQNRGFTPEVGKKVKVLDDPKVL